MKRVVVDRYAGPEVLRLVEEDEFQPGVGEVRVKVPAAGVLSTDALLRAGTDVGAPTPPFTPGYQLAPDVEQLGPARSELWLGWRAHRLERRRGACLPVVAERLPLDEVRRAHELLGQSASVGTLVLIP